MKGISGNSVYITVRFIINIVMICMSLFTFFAALIGIIEDVDIESIYYMVFDTMVLVFCLVYTKHTIEMICNEVIKDFRNSRE